MVCPVIIAISFVYTPFLLLLSCYFSFYRQIGLKNQQQQQIVVGLHTLLLMIVKHFNLNLPPQTLICLLFAAFSGFVFFFVFVLLQGWKV